MKKLYVVDCDGGGRGVLGVEEEEGEGEGVRVES